MIIDRFFWARINAFAALHAGKAGLSLVHALFADGEGRADLNTALTFYASFLIHPDLKGIYLVCEGLEGTKGAEETALYSAFGKDRQDDDKADEERDKDDGLYEDLKGGDLFKLGHGFKRAQPLAISGAQHHSRNQSDDEEDRKREIGPLRIDLFYKRFFHETGKTIIQPAEEAGPAAESTAKSERGANPQDKHARDRGKTSNDRPREDNRSCKGKGN